MPLKGVHRPPPDRGETSRKVWRQLTTAATPGNLPEGERDRFPVSPCAHGEAWSDSPLEDYPAGAICGMEERED